MGRVKQKNTMRDPRVAVAVLDMSNPYQYTEIRGRVVEQIPGQTAEDHIDKLAKKYLGKDKYPFPSSWREACHTKDLTRTRYSATISTRTIEDEQWCELSQN